MGRRGSTITLKGAAATNWRAQQSAYDCNSKEEAEKKIANAGDGPYGAALKAALYARYPSLAPGTQEKPDVEG